MKLGARARAHGRRAGHPWLPSSNLHLSDGPHLFLDWRFVLPGELGLIGPYWAARDGSPIPLRVRDAQEWKDRPIDASYVPTDVPQGIRIAAQPAEKGEPFPEHGPPGTRIIHDEGIYRTWYKTPEDSQRRRPLLRRVVRRLRLDLRHGVRGRLERLPRGRGQREP